MPRFGPIKRKNLIYYLKRLGFEGPYSGAKHQLLIRGDVTVRLPNPHESDIAEDLLSRILKQAQISRREWENI